MAAGQTATKAPKPGEAGAAEAAAVGTPGRGESASFEEIVAVHHGRVAGLARRLLAWPGDVEDVVQEVFVAVLKHLGRFRGDCRVETWLTRITVNTCRTWERKRLLRLKLLRRLERRPAEAAPGAGPAGVDAEVLGRVRRAVGALPWRYREVVVLRYLEQMEVADIATALGVSGNVVSVRLNRARQRLAEKLGELREELP